VTITQLATLAVPPGSRAGPGTAGFDPSVVYAERAPGGVTIEAWNNGQPTASGSGFVVDAKKGVILTNSHVVTNSAEVTDPLKVTSAQQLYVQLSDGERAQAHLVGYDLFDDVAVLQVPPTQMHLVAVPLGSSRALHVGDPVAAIGSPFGEEGSLSVGVVSQLNREIQAPAGVCFDTTDAIQTDAAINHGNSGGPLLDRDGKVVGIDSQIDTTTNAGQGVAFAVPVDSARRSMTAILAGQPVPYAWLGVASRVPVTPPLATSLGLPVSSGVMVGGVAQGSPAAQAKLTNGGWHKVLNGTDVYPDADIVVGVGTHQVTNIEDLQKAVAFYKPGNRVVIHLWRGGRKMRLGVKLANRPLSPKGGCGTLH
jgi:S1-C subfamily serine protease